jgi:hypothetical protein
MAYIIFNSENNILGLAKTDSKKDQYLENNVNSTAIEVSDTIYSDWAKSNIIVKLENGSLVTENVTSYRDEAISDASAAQAEYKFFVDKLKNDFEARKKNYTEVAEMITFLESIDTSSVSSWNISDNILNYIYNLPDCPQIYILEYQY